MKWLLRGSLCFACAWFAACASQPWSVDSSCAGLQRLEGQFLLEVAHEQEMQQLLVVVQKRGRILEILGFNTIGAKLFSGRIAGSEVSTQPAALYRGTDPNALVWGLLVHQSGQDGFRCWRSDDYRIMSEAGGTRLWHGDKLAYVSIGPASFELPAQKITIQVQRLN